MSRPRQHTLFAIVERYLRETSSTREAYATDVVREYERRVDPMHRQVPFHSGGDDPYKDQRLNGQTLRRFMDGELRWAGELEEPMVYALPEPYRGEARRELARRYGMLGAELPSSDGPSQQQHVGDLMRETGQALQAIAPMFEDGVINAGDSPHALRVIRELDDVIAAAKTLRETVATICRIRANTESAK